jgi:hypothetical protein
MTKGHKKSRNMTNNYDMPHGGINVDQHSKLRNKGKYSVLYLHLFRSFEC